MFHYYRDRCWLVNSSSESAYHTWGWGERPYKKASWDLPILPVFPLFLLNAFNNSTKCVSKSVKNSCMIFIPRSSKQSQKVSNQVQEYTNKGIGNFPINSTMKTPAILALRHCWAVCFFIHIMRIIFTASKFTFITLPLEGVWAPFYCEGWTKSQWNVTLMMVPR